MKNVSQDGSLLFLLELSDLLIGIKFHSSSFEMYDLGTKWSMDKSSAEISFPV